jgi:hypothetical protein
MYFKNYLTCHKNLIILTKLVAMLVDAYFEIYQLSLVIEEMCVIPVSC